MLRFQAMASHFWLTCNILIYKGFYRKCDVLTEVTFFLRTFKYERAQACASASGRVRKGVSKSGHIG